jgi:competence protein ComGC
MGYKPYLPAPNGFCLVIPLVLFAVLVVVLLILVPYLL